MPEVQPSCHCHALIRGSSLVGLQLQTYVSHMHLASQCSPQSSTNLCVLRGVMEL